MTGPWVMLAWREPVDVPVEGTGRAVLGVRPRMTTVMQPRACVWCSDALESDVEAAQLHAAQARAANPTLRVVVLPGDCDDPIEAAKEEVMR